jgi:hypothetical protein
MNKVIMLILIAVLPALAGCKSKRKTTPSDIADGKMRTEKEFIKDFAQKSSPAKWVKMTAETSAPDMGITANSELRIRQDSILWIELTAFGIKAARGFATADSVAFTNRLNKTYLAGNYALVEQKLNTAVPFTYLFRVFQAVILEGDADVKIGNNEYLLSKKLDDGNDYYARIEPVFLDCVEQKFYTPTDVLTATYSNFKWVDGYRYPYEITIEVAGKQPLTAVFKVKEIETKGPYSTPFSVGSNYERM